MAGLNNPFIPRAASGIKYSDPDTLAVDTEHNFNWTGLHVFESQTEMSDLIPRATDTYDLGSPLRLWRKGWLSELDTVLFAQQTITLLGGWFVVAKNEGTFSEDVSASDTEIDFGTTMNPGDFVIMRGSLKVEYLQVGSLISGTRYVVTRDLDGTGANDWPAGTPFLVLGAEGDGRIELNAYDTPRLSMLRQGSTYNNQVEMLRLGDLDGNWGYETETYGVAFGEFGENKPNIIIDPVNGLQIRNYTTPVLVLDNTGKATFTGSVNITGGNAATIDYTNQTAWDAQSAAEVYADGAASTAQTNAESFAESVASTAESNAINYTDENAPKKNLSNTTVGWAGSSEVGGPANDTAAVNGVDAATVEAGASRANTGLDEHGNLVTKVIPASLAAPSGVGLYLGSDYLGFYSGSQWASYMDNTGKFYLGGVTGALQWDGETLAVEGAITAQSGSIAGVLGIGLSGGIYQGSGTFETPDTGLKIFNDSGVGLLEMWGGGEKQVYFDTSGQLLAGAGKVQLNAEGVSIDVPSADSFDNVPSKSKVSFTNVAAGGVIGEIGSYVTDAFEPYLNSLAIRAKRIGAYNPSLILAAGDTSLSIWDGDGFISGPQIAAHNCAFISERGIATGTWPAGWGPGKGQLWITTGSDYLPLGYGVLDITSDWNESTAVFTAIKANVTDTASDAASKLIDLQVGGTSKFAVDKSGKIVTGIIDHGDLTGLTDDDHPQYLTEARGDARYVRLPAGTLIALPNNITLTTTNQTLPNFAYTCTSSGLYEITLSTQIDMTCPTGTGYQWVVVELLINGVAQSATIASFNPGGIRLVPMPSKSWRVNLTSGNVVGVRARKTRTQEDTIVINSTHTTLYINQLSLA